ncbi:MAG: hypothetical protein R3D68_08610 [Hyphomicrobiaceae bacterium]
MIAHVAEAGEQKGRVVLQLSGCAPSPIALEAALRVARAFQSEIESLFVEDQQLLDLASLPFAREISRTGGKRLAMSPEAMARQMRALASSLHRQISRMARDAEVPIRATVVRDEPVSAVARACAACGPWNVVAIAEPLTRANAALLQQLFGAVADATGIVIVGPKAKRTKGPVIVAVEELSHLEPMVRAAQRLVAEDGGEGILAILIAENDAEAQQLEGQARLVLPPGTAVTLVRLSPRHGSPVEIVEGLRRMHASFILAQYGGFLVPANSDLEHLTPVLECPLFLVR